MDREWYSDDPQWQESHRDTDSAKAEQRTAKTYREQQERAQQVQDLSTQAAMDEKLAARKHLASQGASGYTEKGKNSFWAKNIENQENKTRKLNTTIEELRLNDGAVFKAFKDYYGSREVVTPTQWQITVDSKSDMIVHTVRHIGSIAVDAVGLASMFSGAVASAATVPATNFAGAIVAFSLLEGAALAGVSLASEIATMINDIATYSSQGRLVVTVGPDSGDVDDIMYWLVF